MNDEIKKLLKDVLMSIEGIDYHLSFKRDFENYKKNLTVKRAVERELEIIGEATSRLLKIQPDIKLSNSRNIISLRNRVIHSYDAVDDNLVWGIISKHIPILKTEVEQLLTE